MSKRRYTHIKVLLPEIKAMLAAGKTQREVKEYFHLQGDRPIHDLLKQERCREKQLEAGLPLRPKGRPRKDCVISSVKEKDYEINRLKMENELLRDFLRIAGRK